MRYVTLGGGLPDASAIVFGCASMGGRVGAREARRALDAAHDAGVNFFDTARSYGLGESERILGAFLKGKRDRVVLCTKAGTYARPPSRAKRLLKDLVRPLLKRAPALRKKVGGAVMRAETKSAVFSVPQMRASLEDSLRELGTDYLDVLLLHQAPAEVAEHEQVLAFFEAVVREGKARRWGISTGLAETDAIVARIGGRAQVLQFPMQATSPEPARTAGGYEHALRMANHAFGGGGTLPLVKSSLRRVAKGASPELRAKIEAPEDDTPVDFLLNGLLATGAADVVVAASFSADHWARNARVAGDSRFTREELAWLRAAVTADLAMTAT
ncbi:MAG TPA: aldo/keto reductase [Polyangiaceae bacterium]|jgi:aryl-alcohol dehydrogenase-like predicted oxidoreductase